MSKRIALPKKLEKQVFQQFESRCPFCDEDDVSTLQIHHMTPYSELKEHKFENLILVCSNCHARITANEIPSAAVERKKRNAAQQYAQRRERDSKSPEINHFVNNGVVATNLTINNQSRSNSSPVVLNGTIGADALSRNYVKYLIDRYHEFKVADVKKDNMKYAILYSALKREFGAKWDHIPLKKLEVLIDWLQSRIDKTILGKTQRAAGNRNYATYEEYSRKHS